MFKIIKLIIFTYMIYSSVLVTFGYAREYEKGKQIITNIVSEDCRKNKKCIRLPQHYVSWFKLKIIN